MKHQLSKVVLAAALAFIGLAGTQNAKAADSVAGVPVSVVPKVAATPAQCPGPDCPPEEPVSRIQCGDTYDTERDYTPQDAQPDGRLRCERPTNSILSGAGCWDTDGDCFAETLYGVEIKSTTCYDTQGTYNGPQKCEYVAYEAAGTCDPED